MALLTALLSATDTDQDVFAGTGTASTDVTGSLSATDQCDDIAALTGLVLVSGELAGADVGGDLMSSCSLTPCRKSCSAGKSIRSGQIHSRPANISRGTR
jgi:hypothetical protein